MIILLIIILIDIYNGILYLKGGDLAEELALTGKRWHVYDIPRFFGEEFFETKKVVYTPR